MVKNRLFQEKTDQFFMIFKKKSVNRPSQLKTDPLGDTGGGGCQKANRYVQGGGGGLLKSVHTTLQNFFQQLFQKMSEKFKYFCLNSSKVHP